jgi:hypothetical protein
MAWAAAEIAVLVLLLVAVVVLPSCIVGCWFYNPWWKCYPRTWLCWPCWHSWHWPGRGRRRVEAVDCVDFRESGNAS